MPRPSGLDHRPESFDLVFRAVDPSTGRTISEHPLASSTEVERRIARAQRAYEDWSRGGFAYRAGFLGELARLLRRERGRLSRLMAVEMGKPVTQGVGEIDKCADGCDYYADNAAAMLNAVEAPTAATRSYWCYRPIGPVLGIMPWNFPFWQVVRFAAPTLALGNSVVVKHAPSVPGCALALARLFQEADFPEGVYTNLFCDDETTGSLIADPRIRAVSLTGSVRAGRAVAAKAGRAVKKCVLELGGSDPAIVLEDADLDHAVEALTWGRMRNAGQSCIAVKRIIVLDKVRDSFEAALASRLREMRLGDPLEPTTDIGPMARIDLRDELHKQVSDSVAKGARPRLGGGPPDPRGAWYPTTLLAEVGPGMAAYEEELFGPVAVTIGARDEEDAVSIANDTDFGLGASVFTSDPERGERIARERLEAGNCFVNRAVESVVNLPFGGIKESGYGRELSPLGITEFANVKTVYVE